MMKKIGITIIISLLILVNSSCSKEGYKSLEDFKKHTFENWIVYEYVTDEYAILYHDYKFNNLQPVSLKKVSGRWIESSDVIELEDKYVFQIATPEDFVDNMTSAYLKHGDEIIYPVNQKLLTVEDSEHLITIFEVDKDKFGDYKLEFLDNEENILDYIYLTGPYDYFPGLTFGELIVDEHEYEYDAEEHYENNPDEIRNKIFRSIINAYYDREDVEIDESQLNLEWQISYTGYNLIMRVSESSGKYIQQNVKITMKWVEDNKYICLEEIFDGDTIIEKNYYSCEMDIDRLEVEEFFKGLDVPPTQSAIVSPTPTP